ncbi:MAG: DUF1080 domain-containing protein [Planctomycetaceae bacterium]|jgi:beta-glucanase (GH16 family)|nr:DUF1080 domain-containing protein [Planctomycetaceae bacterium]
MKKTIDLFGLNIIWAMLILTLAQFQIFAQTVEPPKPFAGGSGKFDKLVWSDEFDGKGLPNPDKWDYEVGHVRNKELQYYTKARLENAEVKDGCLVITARKDNFQVGDQVHPITSASVISKGKGSWTGGRIEVRAKIPVALGTWPAIWMIPEDMRKGWPRFGEIDIMEHVGFEPEKVHFTIHVEKHHRNKTTPGNKIICKDLKETFHVYALEWFDDRLDFYFDDKKVLTYTNDGEGESTWPFDKKFYLILNLAFGGAWGATKGVDESSLPHKFLIDYVRVWDSADAKTADAKIAKESSTGISDAEKAEGFVPMFNAKDLSEWDGNAAIWSVKNGVIVGQTAAEGDAKLTYNQFLIWKGGDVSDFVFRADIKLSKQGNSGFQYRSKLNKNKPFSVSGYQADFDGTHAHSGILYGESFGGILCQRGKEVVIGEKQRPKTINEFAKNDGLKKEFKTEDWNSYEITAKDFTFTHKINGQTTIIAKDEDKDHRQESGIFAIQAHVGPPMKVEIKNLRIKRLKKD